MKLKFWALIISVVWAVQVEAATYWVSKSGNNSNSCTNTATPQTAGAKLTIAAGIGCLSSGDTLNIRAGTYNENIGVSVGQSGTSYANATIIQGYQSENPTLRSIGIGSPSAGQEYKYFVFRNLRLDANGGSWNVSFGGGGNGGAVHHIKLENIETTNATSSSMYLGGADGSGHDLWLTGVTTHDGGGAAPSGNHCWYVEGSNNLIENSDCSNWTGVGIHVYSEGAVIPSNNIFRNNRVHGMGHCGIMLGIGSNNLAESNLVYGNDTGICTFHGNNQRFINNTVFNNSSVGGDFQTGTTNVIVQNNIFSNNGTNITHSSNPDSVTFTTNLCSSSGGTANCVRIEAAGTTFLNTTPGNADFLKLKTGSLAINNGTNANCPATDFAGVSRAGTCDIGAYEFGGVANVNPLIALTSPTIQNQYPTSAATLNIAGTSSDDGTVSSVTWSCDRCGSGSATNTGTNFSTWGVNGITLLAGINVIVFRATDNLGTFTDFTFTVTYAPSFPGNTLAGAWAFDEGSGIAAADSSGNGNSGTLISGATFAAGKFGQALALDGTNDYAQVNDANSLDFTQSFTFSAWVFPTAVHNDWRAVMVKNYMMALYASSDYCGAGTPLIWFYTNGTSGPGFYACYATPLPINQWSHLAGTYDGTNLKLYLNGVLRTTTPATGYMEPSALSLQIGASPYGEYFQGYIDEARADNFGIPITAGVNTVAGAACGYTNYTAQVLANPALASVIGDMNCSIIPASPPLPIKIPSSPTGLKMGAGAAGLKFGQ